MIVKLEIFKKNGKWYTDGNYKTTKIELFDIWEEVRKKAELGNLPGMRNVKGRNYLQEFMISVDVPEHPHNHPHIIVLP